MTISEEVKIYDYQTGPEDGKAITDEVETGRIQRTGSHKYLGSLVNEKGDLEEQIKGKHQETNNNY